MSKAWRLVCFTFPYTLSSFSYFGGGGAYIQSPLLHLWGSGVQSNGS